MINWGVYYAAWQKKAINWFQNVSSGWATWKKRVFWCYRFWSVELQKFKAINQLQIWTFCFILCQDEGQKIKSGEKISLRWFFWWSKNKCLLFQHGKSCSMLRSFSLESKSEVSAKLKLSQLSTLGRTRNSLVWPCAKMETGKRVVLSEQSLLDTCMCVFSVRYLWSVWSGLLQESTSIGNSVKTLNWGKCLFSSMTRDVQRSSHSRSESEKATWFPVAGSNWIPGTRNTAASATKPLASTRS